MAEVTGEIGKVCVIGAGTMGAGIAAQASRGLAYLGEWETPRWGVS